MTLEKRAAKIRDQRQRIAELEAALNADTLALINDAPITLSIRALGEMVGLSPARIGQLAPGRARRGRPAKQTPDGE